MKRPHDTAQLDHQTSIDSHRVGVLSTFAGARRLRSACRRRRGATASHNVAFQGSF